MTQSVFLAQAACLAELAGVPAFGNPTGVRAYGSPTRTHAPLIAVAGKGMQPQTR